MSTLSHTEIWQAIDRLAERLGLTPSALARLAGLDPTSFNRSKRGADRPGRRPRWPSTESIAKMLAACGVSLVEFAALVESGQPPSGKALTPLIDLEQAESDEVFDQDGLPMGGAWKEALLPRLAEGQVYALEIAGDSLAPVYRNGDRVLVFPQSESKSGDRVVVRTTDCRLAIAQVGCITDGAVELFPLNPSQDVSLVPREDLAWMSRIVWASQ